MKIEFNPQERELVEEQFSGYMQVVTVIAKLHGLRGQKLAIVQLAADRTGLLLPDTEGDQSA